MNCWIPKTRGQLLTGLCAVALLTSNSLGGISSKRIVVENVAGVDVEGNASALLGGLGPGKSYKNLRTGIIVQINRSVVSNLFVTSNLLGAPKHFHDRGLPILDPQTNQTLTTTSDFLVVERKQFLRTGVLLFWYGTQICVYDPRFPVLTPATPTTP